MSGRTPSAATPYDPLDARLGRTSSEPVETTKGKPVRSRPPRKKSAAAQQDLELVHTYFGLSYANFAVYPRALLQSMPDEWQARFVALMGEYDAHWSWLPEEDFQPSSYRVQPVEGGKLVSWRSFRLPHYNRGRARVAQDGTVTGGRFPS